MNKFKFICLSLLSLTFSLKAKDNPSSTVKIKADIWEIKKHISSKKSDFKKEDDLRKLNDLLLYIENDMESLDDITPNYVSFSRTYNKELLIIKSY